MKWKSIVLFLTVFIYLILRLGWLDTIEFGYDQPKLASSAIEFIEKPAFLDAQKFVTENAWGYQSWGPMQIFFYAPLLLISRNPVTASVLVAAFNLLSILLVIYIGIKFFSPTVGVVAGIFLATQPWWVIFSRMVYQPTPMPTFVSLAILITFLVIKFKKTIWVASLLPVWSILFQLYYHAISFIGVSLILLSTQVKKISIRYLLLGMVVSLILFFPYIDKTYGAPFLTNTGAEKLSVSGDQSIVSRLKDITPHFVQILAGGDFSWQLGYGYKDFLNENFQTGNIFFVISVLTLLMLVFNTAMLAKKEYRIYRFALILWVIAPVPFLSIVPLPGVIAIPRYFLISLPALSLLWGLTIEALYKRTSIFAIIIFLIPVFWIVFIINYYKFIENYTYPDGHLSTFSDTPYAFLDNSIRYILERAHEDGFQSVIISNDENYPKSFAMDFATSYAWKYVFDKNTKVDPNIKTDYFLIDYSIEKKDPKFTRIFRSGPLTVYQYTDL